MQLDDDTPKAPGGGGGGGGGKSPAPAKPLAVKEANLEPLWGWEAGDGGTEALTGAAAAVWALPPMLSARTSFGAVRHTDTCSLRSHGPTQI